jgi:hypothetical protein
MRHDIPRLLLVLAVLGPARNAPAQVTRLGAHYGVNLTNGAWEDPRLGLQGVGHLVRAMEVSGTFSYFTAWPRVAGLTGTAWQVYGALRIRGPGHWAFASAGYGPVFTHTSLRDPATGLANTVDNVADSAVLGLEAPTPHVRPFADLYLSHLLDRGIMGVNLLMGLHLLIPSP